MDQCRNLFIFFCAVLLSFLFNNCAKPSTGDKNQNTILENQSNGTPYGGKLKPGNYIPAQNQICIDGSEEYIRVVNNEKSPVVKHIIPCEKKEVTLDGNTLSVSIDRNRILFNSFGYAHESTERARDKANYRVACRTTEANFGAEVLVYGLGPIYTFENISLEIDLVVYATSMEFHYQYFMPIRHAFIGDDDILTLTDSETNPNRFTGKWESSTTGDPSKWRHMYCDKLDQVPIYDW